MKLCVLGTVLAASLLTASASTAARHRAAKGDLLEFLRKDLGPADRCLELENPTNVEIAWADLNGDGRPEALVYVSGRAWCGSGGCQLLVLQRTSAGFRKLADVSISKQPVSVLPVSSHGWRDISVYVSGGGLLLGYSAALPFDGKRYAENPSVAPARRLDRTFNAANVFAGSHVGSEHLFRFPPTPAPPANLPEGVVVKEGGRVEIRVPSAASSCWNWVNLTPPEQSGPLRYRTGTVRRDAEGHLWNAWVYEATGVGEADLEFALIPGWRFIYPQEAQRAAAAKIWTAKVVVP